MTNKTVSERLRVLASDDKKRSKAARLRDVLNDVEAALAAGVTQASVVEVLKEGGLEMSMATFKNTLQRLRAKRGGKPSQPVAGSPAAPAKPLAKPSSQSAPAPVQVPAQEEEEEVSTAAASHNPKDIDNIMGATPDLDALAKLGRRKKT